MKFQVILLPTLVSFLVVGCQDHNWRDGIRGRSVHFASRDRNRDDKLTRPEWERMLGTLSGDPNVILFDKMDCNANGVVTWSEYYEYLFRRNRCLVDASSPTPRLDAGEFASSSRLRAPAFCSKGQTSLIGNANYAETSISVDQIGKIAIPCTDLATGLSPDMATYQASCTGGLGGYTVPTTKQFTDITLSNDNSDTAIAMIVFELEHIGSNADENSIVSHTKSIAVQPDSTRTYRAWYNNFDVNADSDTATTVLCNVLHAKGLKTSI